MINKTYMQNMQNGILKALQNKLQCVEKLYDTIENSNVENNAIQNEEVVKAMNDVAIADSIYKKLLNAWENYTANLLMPKILPKEDENINKDQFIATFGDKKVIN